MSLFCCWLKQPTPWLAAAVKWWDLMLFPGFFMMQWGGFFFLFRETGISWNMRAKSHHSSEIVTFLLDLITYINNCSVLLYVVLATEVQLSLRAAFCTLLSLLKVMSVGDCLMLISVCVFSYSACWCSISQSPLLFTLFHSEGFWRHFIDIKLSDS